MPNPIRQENEARFQALEESNEWLTSQVAGLKRKVDRMAKGTMLVAQNMAKCENMYVELVEGANPPRWRELKEKFGACLAQDVGDFLGVAWPPTGPGDTAVRVRKLAENVSVNGVILNIFAQYKWSEAQQEKVRIKGTFTIALDYCIEHLQLKSLFRVLEQDMRKKSGLRVNGEEPDMVVPRQDAVLLWVEKTQEERDRTRARKGDGKGKGAKGKQDPQGKGKGKPKGKKGKGKDKGKGKGIKGVKGPAPAGGDL